MNKQKGAVSVSAVVGVVVILLIIIGIVYWYSQNPAGPPTLTNGTASTTSTTDNSANGSSVTTGSSGQKEYSNFTYGYAIAFPTNSQNSVSNAADVTVSFSTGTGTPAGKLQITAAVDVTHIAYCLTVPQGATNTATTSVNGVGFLSYKVGGTSINSGTTYYRVLHKGPAGNTCYDIQKTPQGSSTVNGQLNGVLQSFTFITSS